MIDVNGQPLRKGNVCAIQIEAKPIDIRTIHEIWVLLRSKNHLEIHLVKARQRIEGDIQLCHIIVWISAGDRIQQGFLSRGGWHTIRSRIAANIWSRSIVCHIPTAENNSRQHHPVGRGQGTAQGKNTAGGLPGRQGMRLQVDRRHDDTLPPTGRQRIDHSCRICGGRHHNRRRAGTNNSETDQRCRESQSSLAVNPEPHSIK